MDRVEGICWNAVLFDVEVVGARLDEFHDSRADRGVQESHSNGGRMTFTVRLNVLKTMRDLEKPLEGFHEAVKEYSCGETSRTDKDFYDPSGSLEINVSAGDCSN